MILLLLLLLLWFVWILAASPKRHKSLSVLAPIRRRNCSGQNVTCLDDCSFLCVEGEAKCLGGVCVVPDHHEIDCNREFGGMVVLAKGPSRHWTCLCTDPTFYGGPDCSERVYDVCQNGVFMYRANGQHTCICNSPYRKVVENGKPYCVEPAMVPFFPDR